MKHLAPWNFAAALLFWPRHQGFTWSQDSQNHSLPLGLHPGRGSRCLMGFSMFFPCFSWLVLVVPRCWVGGPQVVCFGFCMFPPAHWSILHSFTMWASTVHRLVCGVYHIWVSSGRDPSNPLTSLTVSKSISKNLGSCSCSEGGPYIMLCREWTMCEN